MLSTDLVVLGSLLSTDVILMFSDVLTHLPKEWEDQLDPKTSLLFSSKKTKQIPLEKTNLECRGTLTAKPVLKMSTISYISRYFLDPYAFSTIQCLWRRMDGHGTPVLPKNSPNHSSLAISLGLQQSYQ